MTTASTAGRIELETLTDGGQRPADVARGIAGFLSRRSSLDIALYDVRFETDAGALVLASLLGAVQRGVAVRLLYNVDHPARSPSLRRPRRRPKRSRRFRSRRAGRRHPGPHAPQVRRPRRRGDLDRLDELDGRLVVATGERDRHGRIAGIAYAYSLAFGQLWNSGRVAGSGEVEPRPRTTSAARVRAWFCPEHGEALSHRVAKHIGKARQRVRIASPVLTSGPILEPSSRS